MIRIFCVRRMAPVFLVVAMVNCASDAAAEPGTGFRDHLAKEHPIVARLRAHLGVAPLPKQAGKASLRIWDDCASLTFSVAGGELAVTVIHGYGRAWFSIVGEWGGF